MRVVECEWLLSRVGIRQRPPVAAPPLPLAAPNTPSSVPLPALATIPAYRRLLPPPSFLVATKMASGGTHDARRADDPGSNPRVIRVRELISGAASSDGWEKCWEEGVTPWDLGQPTPVILQLAKTGSLPKGRVLVPGCGNGYDVVAIASPEHYVVGMDISNSAIEKAKEWSSSLPNTNQFSFQAADFFTWQPTEKFDLIFDYTFFCAIDPSLRPAWGRKINELLKTDGELITLIYLISDQDEGPPFNNTVSDYEEALHPLGFKAFLMEDNEIAVGPRKGREKLGRWKRVVKPLSFL